MTSYSVSGEHLKSHVTMQCNGEYENQTTPGRQLLLSALVCTAWDYRMGCPVHVRAVILVLESIPITGVSIIANYWIIGSMKF